MTSEKLVKITVKIPESLFQRLKERRTREGVSFQTVGSRLFRDWVVKGEPDVPSRVTAASEREARLCEGLLALLKTGPEWLKTAVSDLILGWQKSQGRNRR